MYLPQIQPVPRNDNLLIHAAENIQENRQRNQLRALATKAVAGDQNALAQLYATDPRSGAGISDYLTQNKEALQQDVIGGLASVISAPETDRPALWSSAVQRLKQKHPGVMDDTPDQYDPNYMREIVTKGAASGGKGSEFFAHLGEQAGYFQTKQPDAVTVARWYATAPAEEKAAYDASHSQAGSKDYYNVNPGGNIISAQELATAQKENRAPNPTFAAPFTPKVVSPNAGLIAPNASGQGATVLYQGPPGKEATPYGAGPTVPGATPEQEQKLSQEAERAKKLGTEQGSLQATAKGKLSNISLIRNQMQKVQQKFEEAKGEQVAGMNATGPGVGHIPTPKGQAFDKSVADLSSFIRQLTRTPGEGAMSDYESRLAQSILPMRTTFENVTQQQIDDLNDILNSLESGYRTLGTDVQKGGTTSPSGNKAAPAAKSVSIRALMSDPRAKGMTEAQVRQKAEARGYTVQ